MNRLAAFLLLLAASAHADVYKSVNDKGEIVYSDQPTPNAKRLNLPELPTYKAPPTPTLPTSSQPQTQAVANPYKSLKMIEPRNDATIRDNQGVVRVRVALDPPLMTKLGHKIQYYLDGKPHGIPVASTNINFSNLDRGTHTLSATVLNAGGTRLMSADPVVFHLHRESVQNPNSPLFKKPKPRSTS